MQTFYMTRLGPMHIAVADLVKPVRSSQNWTITRINVPWKFRGRGEGSILLDRILTDADTEQVTLQLLVSSSGDLDDQELEAWYTRRGFEYGRFGGWCGYMVRQPRKVQANVTENSDHS